ncbi:MAG: glutathione S-transferase [Ponticaulis sp.]|nr:glutathione S-transferase [Ponticaulis sp.]
MLRLLGKAESINVAKVMWACAEMGLEVERENWGAGFKPTADDAFRKLNPNAMVPVLIDDGFVLWESNTILRYLANSRKCADLYPVDAQARAMVDQWLDWQASDLNSAWRYVFSAKVRKFAEFSDPAEIAKSEAAWIRCMTVLNGQLAHTGGYVAGPDFKLADIPIGLSVLRWTHCDFEKPDLPLVAAYFERLRLRPAFVTHGIETMR